MSGNIDIILNAFLADYGAKLHVREMARMMGMNRQTTSETLKKMEDERILDSEISGRNKLYFINKSNQKAKILVENAENRKKFDICARKREIARLVEYIDTPAIVLLFGSYAKENERESSDIDLLVIGRKMDFKKFEKETRREVQTFEVSEREFLDRLAKKDHLVIEAIRDHVCLKNTERFIDIMWRAVYG